MVFLLSLLEYNTASHVYIQVCIIYKNITISHACMTSWLLLCNIIIDLRNCADSCMTWYDLHTDLWLHASCYILCMLHFTRTNPANSNLLVAIFVDAPGTVQLVCNPFNGFRDHHPHSCPEICIEPRTPIYFYYRLIRQASISIYKLSTRYLQAHCSNRYRGYRRFLINAYRTSERNARNFRTWYLIWKAQISYSRFSSVIIWNFNPSTA